MTEIVMLERLRGEVLSGKRSSGFRPGHRAYRPGPAKIRFVKTDLSWSDVQHVDVILTKVEHAQAEGKHRKYMAFLGEDPDKITWLEWRLA